MTAQVVITEGAAMRLFGFAAAAAAILAASVAAQDAPTEIKFGHGKAGERLKVVASEKVETRTNSGGKEKIDIKIVGLIFTDEIETAAPGKRPTKLKRTFDKATLNTTGKLNPLPVQGKTVVVEKKGAKYAFTADGKPVDADTQAVLEAEFNAPARNVALLWPAKVKMGDGWDVDRAKVVGALAEKGLQLDKAGATGTGKVPLVEMRGEKRFGKVQVEASAPVTGLGDKSPLQLKSGKLTFNYTNEFCIDGTSPQSDLSVVTKLEVTGTADGQEVTVVTTTTETRRLTVLPPDKKKK